MATKNQFLHQIEDWSMYQIDRRTTWLKLIGKGPLVRPSLYRYPRLYWDVINCWAFNKVIERFYPELCLLKQPTPCVFWVNWSEEQAGLSWATLRLSYYNKRFKALEVFSCKWYHLFIVHVPLKQSFINVIFPDGFFNLFLLTQNVPSGLRNVACELDEAFQLY